jgi:hypothetical protein
MCVCVCVCAHACVIVYVCLSLSLSLSLSQAVRNGAYEGRFIIFVAAICLSDYQQTGTNKMTWIKQDDYNIFWLCGS